METKQQVDIATGTMHSDPIYARAPLRPTDPQSSPSPDDHNHNYKRQESQTLNTTFVSTAVVPAPSSTDVLSSLISSLTLLSDSAREHIRNAREIDQDYAELTYDPTYPAFTSSSGGEAPFRISTERAASAIDTSDGGEADAPIVGYTRPSTREQKRPHSRDKWMSYSSAREKPSTLGRSDFGHPIYRSQSETSSTIGVPSIERAQNESYNTLVLAQAAGTRGPLKMLFSSRQDEDSNSLAELPSQEAEVKSVRSFKTTKSKHSVNVSAGQEWKTQDPGLPTPYQQQKPIEHARNVSMDHKTYSPLSPANRDDLGEHLIPSRRSSIRHSPKRGRGSSKAGSPNDRRTSSFHSKSPSGGFPEIVKLDLSSDILDEDDSTVRRIRELQQAKEKRQYESRKESRKSERPGRQSSRSRSKSGSEVLSSKIISIPIKHSEAFDQALVRNISIVSNAGAEKVAAPSVQEVDAPSSTHIVNLGIPSPALSIPQTHSRSLSAGLRSSTSSKYHPSDDLRTVSEQVEAYLSSPRLTQKIRHPRTGRTIAFSEVGDPDGYAVICCVGMGLTRFVTSFYSDVARTMKLRLITPDRPGIGESSPFPDNIRTPLAWVDDVEIICQALNIDKFSLLAHSAGAIYALATALKMPDRVRGRIHLLAPWIPPSQFPNGAANSDIKAVNLPMAHKILSILPAPFLRAANSRFLSAASASIEPRVSKNRKKDQYDNLLAEMAADISPAALSRAETASTRYSSASHYTPTPTPTPPPYRYNNGVVSPPISPSPTNMRRQFSSSARKFRSPTPNDSSFVLTPSNKQALFNKELTHRTWALATKNANPAVDLLVCLERKRPIGFRYVDVTRGAVIHHGRDDARVPLANAQWLQKAMRECELRILDNEGHGLMASANVMSRVLGEIGQEWERWAVIANDNERERVKREVEVKRLREQERRRIIRQGH